MKKKILSLLLCVMLVAGLIPTGMWVAQAATTSVKVGSDTLTDGDSAYDGKAIFKDGVLTLNGLELTEKITTRDDAVIICDGDLTIHLIGTSKVTNEGPQSHAVRVNGNLTFAGSGSLECKVTDYVDPNLVTTNNSAFDPLYVTGTLNFGGADASAVFSGRVEAYAPSGTDAGQAIHAATINIYGGTVEAENKDASYKGISANVNLYGGKLIASGGSKAVNGTVKFPSGGSYRVSTGESFQPAENNEYSGSDKYFEAMANFVHEHPICGAVCGHDEGHAAVEFKEFPTSGSLETGNYALSGTTTLEKTFGIKGDVTICLNGHELRAKGLRHFDIKEGGTLTICDCSGTNAGTITGGSSGAERGGSAVIHNGTLNLYGGTFAGNKTDKGGNTAGARGGAIAVGTTETETNCTFNMYGGVITGNSVLAARGSAVSVGGSAGGNCTFNMYLGTISNNTATGDGDAVIVGKNGTFKMFGGFISNNKRGVGVDGGTFEMTGRSAQISNNGTGVIDGGGVYISSGTFRMSNGKICNNTLTDDENVNSNGAGVFMNGGYFSMTGGEITGNSVLGPNSDGGGVMVDGDGVFEMSGGKIYENTAKWGGGVCVAGDKTSLFGTFNMSGGEISDNRVTESGGGVCISYGGDFTMTGGSITGNKAAVVGGGVQNFGRAPTGEESVITLSGDIDISDNTSGHSDVTAENPTSVGHSDNIYLAEGQTITLGGIMANEKAIGVQLQTMPTAANTPIVFAEEANGAVGAAQDALTNGRFSVNAEPGTPDEDCIMELTGTQDGLQLTYVSPHMHTINSEDIKHYELKDFTQGALAERKVFLPADLTLTGDVTISGSVHICLNGKLLNMNGFRIRVPDGATLTVCDCETDGAATHGGVVNYAGLWVAGGSGVTLEGGVAWGGRVEVAGGSLVLQGGNLAGLYGGVKLTGGGSMTVSGGRLCHNAK